MKTYKLDAPKEIDTTEKYSSWVWPYCQFDDPTNPHFYISVIGMFTMDGICTHPNAQEVIEPEVKQ